MDRRHFIGASLLAICAPVTSVAVAENSAPVRHKTYQYAVYSETLIGEKWFQTMAFAGGTLETKQVEERYLKDRPKDVLTLPWIFYKMGQEGWRLVQISKDARTDGKDTSYFFEKED